MKSKSIFVNRSGRTRLLSRGLRFVLTAALTFSQIPTGYAPFALGCIAASGSGIDGMTALLGGISGAALFLKFADALPFMAMSILIVTTATASQNTRLAHKQWFMPLTATAISLMVDGVYIWQSLSPLAHLPNCLSAALLTGISAWFLPPLFRPEKNQQAQNAVLFIIGALLLPLCAARIFKISLGRTILCALLLYTAYERPAAAAAAAGLGAGLATDIANGEVIYTAAYGLSCLAAGNCQSRPGASVIFLITAPMIYLPLEFGEALPILLVECALGSAIFLLLPSRLFDHRHIRRVPASAIANISSVSEQLTRKLHRAAAALRDLYDSMGRSTPLPEGENPATVFDRAAEKICRDCVLCDVCWKKEYSGTFNALNQVLPILLERGRALSKDFPRHFTNRCIHLTEFLNAINSELSAYLLRRQYRRQLEETRQNAKGQYAQLSELLNATAASLQASVTEKRAAGICHIGAALRPKSGENVCGDTLESFRLDNGQWCILLADGMGSGEEARRESALTCRLLRQFLEAEIEPEAALKTLNAAMALRSTETGSFTTIDLCLCNAGDGTLAFYKFGAAPSYIKKGGVVRRVTGCSLPAGLRSAPAVPDVTRASLDEGSFVVMVSDGIADTERDEWLQNLLAGWDGVDPQELAELILSTSIEREHLQDDCGVQVLYRQKPATQNV